eukprot:jgi/Mesvir1/13684/Mv02120-RA.1
MEQLDEFLPSLLLDEMPRATSAPPQLDDLQKVYAAELVQSSGGGNYMNLVRIQDGIHPSMDVRCDADYELFYKEFSGTRKLPRPMNPRTLYTELPYRFLENKANATRAEVGNDGYFYGDSEQASGEDDKGSYPADDQGLPNALARMSLAADGSIQPDASHSPPVGDYGFSPSQTIPEGSPPRVQPRQQTPSPPPALAQPPPSLQLLQQLGRPSLDLLQREQRSSWAPSSSIARAQLAQAAAAAASSGEDLATFLAHRPMRMSDSMTARSGRLSDSAGSSGHPPRPTRFSDSAGSRGIALAPNADGSGVGRYAPLSSSSLMSSSSQAHQLGVLSREGYTALYNNLASLNPQQQRRLMEQLKSAEGTEYAMSLAAAAAAAVTGVATPPGPASRSPDPTIRGGNALHSNRSSVSSSTGTGSGPGSSPGLGAGGAGMSAGGAVGMVGGSIGHHHLHSNGVVGGGGISNGGYGTVGASPDRERRTSVGQRGVPPSEMQALWSQPRNVQPLPQQPQPLASPPAPPPQQQMLPSSPAMSQPLGPPGGISPALTPQQLLLHQQQQQQQQHLLQQQQQMLLLQQQHQQLQQLQEFIKQQQLSAAAMSPFGGGFTSHPGMGAHMQGMPTPPIVASPPAPPPMVAPGVGVAQPLVGVCKMFATQGYCAMGAACSLPHIPLSQILPLFAPMVAPPPNAATLATAAGMSPPMGDVLGGDMAMHGLPGKGGAMWGSAWAGSKHAGPSSSINAAAAAAGAAGATPGGGAASSSSSGRRSKSGRRKSGSTGAEGGDGGKQNGEGKGGAVSSAKYISLEDVQGRIYQIAKDQHGCRFLQKKFDEGGEREVEIIFREIVDHVVELMTDPFGNYLVQKLLLCCNASQRHEVLLQVCGAGELINISLDMHGTRAVQRLVETLSPGEQTRMVIRALRPGVVTLIKDLNGNHVIQRCLQTLSPQDSGFIFDAAAAHCVEISTHRHGCCVLQRCVDHATGAEQQRLLQQIAANALVLAQDPFGNYVVQYILDLRLPWISYEVMRRLEGHYPFLATQKFSSNVVEKCVKLASDEGSRSRLVHELATSPRLGYLLHDPYANYVIQSCLATTQQRTTVIPKVPGPPPRQRA